MATITLGTVEYSSYSSVEDADDYLAADAYLYASWAGLTTTGAKERALISSTRYLANLEWKEGVPEYEAPADIVRDAAIILAANIGLKPKLLETLGTGDNLKRVKAGSAEVEFFTATVAKILPSRLQIALRDMLGYAVSDDVLSDLASPFDGGAGQDRCLDENHFDLSKPYS